MTTAPAEHHRGADGTQKIPLTQSIGVANSSVEGALDLPSFHVENQIAKALGLPAPALFPERYGPDGERRHTLRPRKRNKAVSFPHVQSAERA